MTDTTSGIEKDVLAQALEAEATLEKAMSRREMRRLGMTVLNVRRRARQMAIDGEIDSTMSPEQIRDTVLDDLQIDEPRMFEQVSALDWDAIIQFVTALIPLILKIISMFGL